MSKAIRFKIKEPKRPLSTAEILAKKFPNENKEKLMKINIVFNEAILFNAPKIAQKGERVLRNKQRVLLNFIRSNGMFKEIPSRQKMTEILFTLAVKRKASQVEQQAPRSLPRCLSCFQLLATFGMQSGWCKSFNKTSGGASLRCLNPRCVSYGNEA